MQKSVATIVAMAVLVSCGGSDASSDSDVVASVPLESSAPSLTDSSTVVEETATTAAAATTSTTTTTVVLAAVADAISIEPAVDVKFGSATAFSPVGGPEPVAAGDTVRTDGSGFAEVAYFDGSLTRLDIDTEFEVLELVDVVDESIVRTRMGLGRTWHRVETLGETGEFSVETSVATAVVQGTAFSVECFDETSCTFMVVEGALRVDLEDGTSVDLVAPAALVVDADGVSEPVPVSFDAAFGDEWLFDNGLRDVDNDDLSPAEIFEAYGPTYGSITGTFTGTRTVTSLECVTVCIGPGVGDVAERSYTFDIDCSAGIPCTGTIDTEYVDNGENVRALLPVEFDGTTFRWTRVSSGASCETDNDGDGVFETTTGNTDSTLNWDMTPTAAEIADDRWVVTAMSGTVEALNIATDLGECAGQGLTEESRETADIVVTRES